MKIIDTRKDTVPFSQLPFGEGFEFDGVTYIKILNEMDAPVALNTKSCAAAVIGSQSKVSPVDMELHITR